MYIFDFSKIMVLMSFHLKHYYFLQLNVNVKVIIKKMDKKYNEK